MKWYFWVLIIIVVAIVAYYIGNKRNFIYRGKLYRKVDGQCIRLMGSEIKEDEGVSLKIASESYCS